MKETIIEIAKTIKDFLTDQGFNAEMLGLQDNVIIDQNTDYLVNVIVPSGQDRYDVLKQGYMLVNVCVPNLSDGRPNLKRLNEVTEQVAGSLEERIENVYLDLKSISQTFIYEKDYSYMSLRINFTLT